MRVYLQITLASVSFGALSTAALAQSASAGSGIASADAEIVVSARRKDESIQDVPLTVNAVSSETLQKLNLRDLKDITAVVPGLVLNPGNRTTGQVISLRGLAIDNTTSGNNGTVQFYLNDSPITSGAVLQSLYDVGQIEVLRGPQGTLRGVASPSGSITLTTRRPDMYDFGGYVQGQVNTLDGYKIEGAVNLPIVRDVLALRVAGMYDKNEGSRVHSTSRPGIDQYNKSKGVRASVRFTPSSNFEANASYSHFVRDFRIWDQVESANLADPSNPASPLTIRPRDRLAVESVANIGHQAFDFFNWQAQWSFAGQRLNYVGGYLRQDLRGAEPTDKGNFFDSTYPGDATLPNNNGTYALPAPSTLNLQNLAPVSHSYARAYSHEVRLSSEERMFDMFDYVVGVFMTKLSPSTDQVSVRTANFAGVVSPSTFTGISTSLLTRRGRTIERAAFGNLTAHLGESTEVSGGIRYLNYQENLNGTNNSFKATVWTASAKHRFNDDLMIYASGGSSFRVGSGTNALILGRNVDIDTIVDPFLSAMIPITPERSTSYEIGFRSTWWNKKITLNVSAFLQNFKNYIFPVSPYYVLNNTGTAAAPVLTDSNVVLGIATTAAPVPAKVKGIEAEIGFRPSDRFNLAATLAYADAKMSNAIIPCTPPGVTGVPTAAQIQAGGSATTQVSQCAVNQRASKSAPFSGSLMSEYNHPISNSANAFLRGLASFYGDSQNDPGNPYDDVSAYALINLYAGVRAEDGSWEVSAYARNLFNTFRVTDRAFPLASVPTNLGTRNSTYRLISTTDPREFGITARFAFGSR